jgi:uncharacterized membrane protein YdjX (TVP38/TMEM64 family)
LKSVTKKKIIAISLLVVVIAILTAIVLTTCMPMLKMADDPDEFRLYMENRGLGGVVFFIFVTVIQVIAAVIPGGPLEVAAGYCFGPFKGALICDLGMTIGSLIVFLLVRKFGMAFIEIFISREKIESLKFLKTTGQSRLVIFILFLIPGSPKDILAYAVGLTDLSVVSWIFITSVGRFPSILLSTLSGDALGDQKYSLFIAVIIMIAVLAGIGGFLYRRWAKKNEQSK